MRSLVIEDEPQIGRYLGRLPEQLRGIVDIVDSVADARQALDSFKYDLAIVDRMLLAAVTRDVLADFSPAALDAGIEMSLEMAEEGATVVQGVESAVRSALANLVSNVLIHARGARRIVANLTRGSVSISDDGAGNAQGSAQKLVEPFQTCEPAKGAGLGLAIVQEIMAAHGGQLIMTSRPDAGTTACLRFPEAVSETADEAVSAQLETAEGVG